MNESINCKIVLRLHRLSPDPSYLQYKRIAFASSQGPALLGFFPYVIIFSQSLINADIILPLCSEPDPQSAPKESMGPYLAKLFFL